MTTKFIQFNKLLTNQSSKKYEYKTILYSRQSRRLIILTEIIYVIAIKTHNKALMKICNRIQQYTNQNKDGILLLELKPYIKYSNSMYIIKNELFNDNNKLGDIIVSIINELQHTIKDIQTNTIQSKHKKLLLNLYYAELLLTKISKKNKGNENIKINNKIKEAIS